MILLGGQQLGAQFNKCALAIQSMWRFHRVNSSRKEATNMNELNFCMLANNSMMILMAIH